MNKLVLFLLLGCASVHLTKKIGNDDAAALLELKEQIQGWVEPCTDGALIYPCERIGNDTNEDHVTLWSGLYCLATGDFCEVPAMALGNNGRLWRSPSQVDVKVGNSCSRDMVDGLLASLVKTKNQDAAWRFYQYLEYHNWQLCDDANDNRCDMNPMQYRALWGTLKRVWQSMDLQTTPTIDKAADLDEITLLAQAQGSPIGYQLHLVATQLHIRRYLHRWSDVLQKTANTLIKKDPDNPYFEWIAKGSTRKAIDLVLQKCSKAPGVNRNDWLWSQGKNSMGYDCLFMIGLLGS